MKTWQIADKVAEFARGRDRTLIGIAGAPGSGKSTLAADLKTALLERHYSSVVVPMDGFHLDNAVLKKRDLLPVKGAPETFDAAGFIDMIARIAKAGDDVFVPVFNREEDRSTAAADVVLETDRIALVEGNYLLLHDEPWAQLQPLFDQTIFLNPSMDVLEQRLIRRWLGYGYEEAAARHKALSNDIPNALTVLKKSSEADIMISDWER